MPFGRGLGDGGGDELSYSLHLGDCLEVMPTLPANSVDSIVCDPPYGLSFMGRAWDHGVPGVPFWEAALRVAKPGAMLLAFGGTRTHHRLMVAIEDAGWEIRDCLMWLYGSGMPKGHNISKAIDKMAGAEREVIGRNQFADRRPNPMNGTAYQMNATRWDISANLDITAPATPEAAQWSGFNTNLKPAWEPIILARAPLSEPTIAQNVLRWGTGALNIDATRIGTDDDRSRPPRTPNAIYGNGNGTNHTPSESHSAGRWPANLLLSDEAAALLDQMSGERPSGSGNKSPRKHDDNTIYGKGLGYSPNPSIGGDSGGASRFFANFAHDDDEPLRFLYCGKASAKDRSEGLEGMPEVDASVGDRRPSGSMSQRIHADEGRPDTKARNFHPCCKPTPLMKYLVRLISPPGGTVLDPFAGSGSTLKAAILEGFDCVGIDNSEEYLAIAEARCAHAAAQYAADHAQPGLFDATA